MSLVDQIIGVESGGNPNARNPRSSASGPGQFLDSTWLSMIGKYRPDLAGLPRDQILGLKSDPALAREMTGRYADENAAGFRASGIPVNDTSQYLGHFLGLGGARSLYGADPSTPAADVVGPGVVKANPFLSGMTAGDVIGWAGRKMGQSVPAMQMPGASPKAGAFGLAGPVTTDAPAAAKVMPDAPAPDTSSIDVLHLLKLLEPTSGTAAGQQAQVAPAAPQQSRQAPEPPRFDPSAFFALLNGRAR